MISLALYQPEIAGNVGAVIRLAACFNAPLHIIEPCGFPLSDKKLKRASLDYGPEAQINRWADWAAFRSGINGRLVLMTTKAQSGLYHTAFKAGDVLLFGQESAGVPADVAASVDLKSRIPMHQGMRSLNLGMSAAIALSEALRQTDVLTGDHFQ